MDEEDQNKSKTVMLLAGGAIAGLIIGYFIGHPFVVSSIGIMAGVLASSRTSG